MKYIYYNTFAIISVLPLFFFIKNIKWGKIKKKWKYENNKINK